MIITDPDDYQSSSAVSFSKLRVFDRCPLLYHKRYIAKTASPQEETDAMRLGSAAHCLLLEGDTVFARRYVVRPASYAAEKSGEKKPWNRNAKICQAWEDSQTRTPLSADEYSALEAMRISLASNREASKLLAFGDSELAIRNAHPSGLECQGRLDWLTEGGCVVDLKTIENIDDLPSVIETRSYYRQLAFYRDLARREYGRENVTSCAIIGIEKAEPRRCAVLYLSESLLDLGTVANEASLARLLRAIDTDEWGGNPETRELAPSAWLALEAR